MKAKILIALAITCLSAAAFADTERKATKEEVKMFCAEIDFQMEDQQVDMAINYKKCLKSKMRVITDEEGTFIGGPVPFRAPERPEFKNICMAEILNGEIVTESVDCSLGEE